MLADPRWMFVCKPLRSPFNDGSTVLVRDLITSLPSSRGLTYLGDPAQPVRADADDEIILAAAMGHAPSLGDKLGVLRQLANFRRRRQPLHFFFTPNRVTSSVLAGMRRLTPRRRMVQSLMSSHGVARWVELLRPLDRVVVLSDHAKHSLVEAGLATQRVVRIYPGVGQVPDFSPPAGPVQLLYAGDLDGGVVSRLEAIAQALQAGRLGDASLIVACRPKAEQDARHRARLRQALGPLAIDGRAELLAEIDDMDALMRRCSVQLFVADHVRHKVDLPLVLLEGLARGLPLVSIDFPPVAEIYRLARGHGLDVGTAVSDHDHEALVDAVRVLSTDANRRRVAANGARELVRRELTLSTMAAQYDALYRELE